MEAKELMIGDWVWYDGQPYQIRRLGIFGENRDGESFPAVCVGKPIGIGLIVERNEIEPIPLTPEILEKNGFAFNNLPIEQCWQQYGLHLYLSGHGYAINCGENVSLRIDYVHQLQHALRLCGIENEIEL